MSLRIAKDLELPVDAVTGTFGILATKGAGKSNAAVVMAEEMYDVGVPWVAIDPKGDWYGLRSSADGDGPGLPIVVFGGRHGDVPLEPTAGALLADLVLDQRLTCVLDVSQFTKADTTRFLLAFGRRLFQHADDDGAEPLHLFLEEAHEYLPQAVHGDQAELVNVWQRIVKQGRFKGLGVTLISQRSSVLNKDVLELIDTLVVLRTIGPLSRKSIESWVKDQDVDPGLMSSLPTLGNGEAWIWSPGSLGLMQRIQFRRRRTFDSGATPKVGQARRVPATLADVDLAAIKTQMAATIEKAKADDPRELRRRIAELERAAAAVPPPAEPEVREVRVEVPVLNGQVGDLRSATEQLLIAADLITAAATSIVTAIDRVSESPRSAPEHRPVSTQTRATAQGPSGAPRAAAAARTRVAEPATTPDPAQKAGAGAPLRPLSKAERLILAALAQYPQGRTKVQVALLTGYAHSGGGFNNAISALRSAGMVAGGKDRLTATEAGLVALGGDWEPLPSGRALLDHWLPQLSKAERAILEALADAYPNAVPKEELGPLTGYEASGGGFNNALSRLRTLELIERGTPRMSDDLA